MAAIAAMLFDLDGTLLDSAPDLVDALNRVRETEGLAPLEVAAMRRFVSDGASGLVRAGMPVADDARFEAWREQLIENYARQLYARSKLFDGVPELLDALDEAGVSWGIVTHKRERFTLPILKAAGLGRRVGPVVCGDTIEEVKPHPEPVRLACRLAGVAPADTVFVGDDLRDLQAGQAAGTRTAAVYYGYGSPGIEGPLAQESITVNHPADLIGLLG